MKHVELTQKVLARVSHACGQMYGCIDMDAPWHDLGLNSLDLVELCIAIEDEFDIDIPYEEAMKWLNVQDIIHYLEEQFTSVSKGYKMPRGDLKKKDLTQGDKERHIFARAKLDLHDGAGPFEVTYKVGLLEPHTIYQVHYFGPKQDGNLPNLENVLFWYNLYKEIYAREGVAMPT